MTLPDHCLVSCSTFQHFVYFLFACVRFRLLSQFSIYQLIFVPTLTYGHELRLVTERRRSRVQASEMTYLCRVARLSLIERVRNSVIREELGVEPLFLYVQRSRMWWLGHPARIPPW